MPHATAPDLSFAPRFRPFYPGDVEGYSSALDSLVYPGDLRVRSANPAMSLKACRLVGGGLAISFSSTPFEMCHKAEHVSAADEGDVLATIAVEGEGVFEQAGRQMAFGKGDIAFRTTRLPSTFSLQKPCQLMVLRLPAARFFGLYGDLSERFRPSIARADALLVATARDHLAHVFPELPHLGAASAYFSEQSFVSLLAAIYCESNPDAAANTGAGEPDRWQRLVACIEAHLCDPDLSVETIARDLRISKRLAHRQFEARGMQYGAYLRMRRLERAHGELTNARLDHLSVAEIAYRNGFNDPSHFNRCFRSRFGLPPGTLRKAVTAGARRPCIPDASP
jgi:AraC-like DNA-binding protein